MLYKRNICKFDYSLFAHPTKEYRGAPFWAWNCKLDRETLLEQIDYFEEMGMGGAHIHCRVGLDVPYLGEEFFDHVSACEKRMKEKDLLCWLYDEDRWPSGSAGGLVTREEKYRARFLVFEPEQVKSSRQEGIVAAAKAVRSGNKKFLGSFFICLSGEGQLIKYEKISSKSDRLNLEANHPEGTIWSAWLEISGDTPWFNDQAYVNTLDKKAIDKFIALTHEAYFRHLGKDFGKTIPAIFTDEPQTCHKEILTDPLDEQPVIMPFTDDFEETFQTKFNVSVLNHLPELVWELEDGRISQIRYNYQRHVCERFSQAFGDNIGKWCEEHNIALTGHMLNEWTLYSQTMALGEVMRPLKHFTIPGIDMLCDRRELSTAKQTESIVHQMGREGMMSEIYGVTGWSFDFRNHKLSGDWQAALGVTVRVPHLTWVSMAGEAKRDYPASIGYQSPWYKEYRYIENHFARLNTALTRGRPEVNVGIIHPIESYWLYWGNQKQTGSMRQALESNFENLISWMLYGLIDFDFISESVLAEEEKAQCSDRFVMGEMRYNVVLVPGCITLRKSTLDRLETFQKDGGKVMFLGEIPKYLDGEISRRPSEFAKKCIKVEYNAGRILDCLESYRMVDITSTFMEGVDSTRMKHRENGTRTNNMFYQMRAEGDKKWLFVCHVNKPVNEHITFTEELKIIVKGEYQARYLNTLNGEILELGADYVNGDTVITAYTSAHDSLLFHLSPGRRTKGYQFKYHQPENVHSLPQPEAFKLEEENCCLLDQAEYSFDGGEWESREELLRIDNLFREKLGYPLRMEALAQPWTRQIEEEQEHVLKLRFNIYAETDVDEVMLAGEYIPYSEILWNTKKIIYKDAGWYVDKCLSKCRIPGIKKGINVLELVIPFNSKTNIEWCYLLGNFGVMVLGREQRIMAMPRKIYYGDFALQGLPFYAGNLVYETTVETEEGKLWIETSQYRGALLQVQVDDKEFENLIFAPYRLNCGRVKAGRHNIRIKVFGNRANAFGAVHHADDSEVWYGPNLWRTRGNKWSYEYQLEKMGILTTPMYWVEK
jgi:hypothetical protein